MTGYHVWKRWCSVCGQLKADVYPDGCTEIECACGAWIQVPALSVIDDQWSKVERLVAECVDWRKASTGDKWTGQVQRVMEAVDALDAAPRQPGPARSAARRE